MTDDESRKGDPIYEHLQRFLRAGKADSVDTLLAAMERIEVDLLLADMPSSQRHLMRAGLDYLRFMLRERGAAPKYDVLRELNTALKDEDGS
jgi:hypothetical protein